MASKSGYPLIARGSLVAWDFEFRARRAVAEEDGEIARMHEDTAAQARRLSDQMRESDQARMVQQQVAQQEALYQETAQRLSAHPGPEPSAPSSPSEQPHPEHPHQCAREIELLMQERAALLLKVEQQAAVLAQWSVEIESLRRFSAIARGVMVDLTGSRGYAMMRLLGRWRSIERGISRALR